MGDYATTTSISLILPGFLKGDTTTVDLEGTSRFSKSVTRAESVINGLISRRYALPFIVGTTTTNVPPILRTIAEDIACYYSMRKTFNQDGKIVNPYLAEYKSAMKLLESIAAGTAALSYTDGSEVPAQSSNLMKSTTRNFRPVFGLDDPPNWRRDPDEVRQTEAERNET